MGLTAIEIFKFLPKTNCGECGFPTCLAFAMQLANKKAELASCPDVSDEAKAELEASAAPPMRLVTMGKGENKVEVGNETEMFRHEKKFFHHAAYGLVLDDDLSGEEIGERLSGVDDLETERVGLPLVVELIALRGASGNPDNFSEKAKIVASKTHRPLVLIAENPEVLKAGAEAVSGSSPLLHAADKDNWEETGEIAADTGSSLVVKGDTAEELADLTKKLKDKGVQDMVLDMDFGSMAPSEAIKNLTILRRLALRKNFRPLGFPTIMFSRGDDYQSGIMAILGTLKYANIVLFDDMAAWKLYPLFVLRQNIFTDPQKPIQVQPDIYPINNPEPGAPLLLTCNFSLTYFSVKGDVERAKVPANILVVDTEGLSVLTAYAAEKLTPESMAEALEDPECGEATSKKEVIIPGLIARARAKLLDLTGFDVIVGPKDSSGIPKFLKNR